MKKIYLTIIIVLSISKSINAQENAYELMGFPEVIINKEYTAYTVSYLETRNGLQSDLKTNNPNVNNPYNIRIASNGENGRIIVNNQQQPEDIFVNYKKIYKQVEGNKINYYFTTTDNKYSISYIVEQNTNDLLIITYKADDKNKNVIIYTISKI